jgi:hypothetical protein
METFFSLDKGIIGNRCVAAGSDAGNGLDDHLGNRIASVVCSWDLCADHGGTSGLARVIYRFARLFGAMYFENPRKFEMNLITIFRLVSTQDISIISFSTSTYQGPIEVVLFIICPTTESSFESTVPFAPQPHLEGHIVNCHKPTEPAVRVGRFLRNSLENNLTTIISHKRKKESLRSCERKRTIVKY